MSIYFGMKDIFVFVFVPSGRNLNAEVCSRHGKEEKNSGGSGKQNLEKCLCGVVKKEALHVSKYKIGCRIP